MFVKKLSNLAKLPVRSSDGAAGLDLFATTEHTLQPGERHLFPTDLSFDMPIGVFAHILPRSGLALKYGIHVGAGVIDSDYRGNVGVLLFNLGQEPFQVNPGDRIAQLVLKPYLVLPVKEVDQITSSDRGAGGFGSTGV